MLVDLEEDPGRIGKVNDRINDTLGGKRLAAEQCYQCPRHAWQVPARIVAQGIVPDGHTADQLKTVVMPFRAQLKLAVLALVVTERDDPCTIAHGPYGSG